MQSVGIAVIEDGDGEVGLKGCEGWCVDVADLGVEWQLRLRHCNAKRENNSHAQICAMNTSLFFILFDALHLLHLLHSFTYCCPNCIVSRHIIYVTPLPIIMSCRLQFHNIVLVFHS